jgi:tetratricopeptide (TPR) repeat protein
VTVDGLPKVEADTEATAGRWYLEDERDFLRRSLDDADREHDAGDLADEDHAALVARDASRLADVESQLASLGEAETERAEAAAESGAEGADGEAEARPPMPLWRRVGIVASCLLIGAGAVILVVHFVSSRQPGQPSSGTVTLSQAQQIEQQLQQALALNNRGDTKSALALYDKVLSEDPSNPAALAYAGYLQWNVGSSAHVADLVRIGRAEIERAVQVAPTYYEGHLFFGLVLENQDHDHAAAVTQFNDFLADGPPPAELPQVAPLVAGAYRAAGDPLPAAFGSGSAPSAP